MTDARSDALAAGDPCVGNVFVLDSTGDARGLAAGVVEAWALLELESAVFVLVWVSELSTVWPAGWLTAALVLSPRPLSFSLDFRSLNKGGLSVVGVPLVLEGFLLNSPPVSKLGVERPSMPLPNSSSSPLSFLPTAAPSTEVARWSILTVLTEADRGLVAGFAG